MTYNTGQRHKHWKVLVPAGPYKIKLSGLFGAPPWLSTRNKMRGNGIYLDGLWEEVLKPKGFHWLPKWPDRRTVPVAMVHSLIKYLKNKLEEGQTPEIACLGGHGRTGTLYACLLVNLEQLPPRKAVEQVWIRYCGAALETLSQMKLVYQYYNWLRRNGNNDFS